VSTEARREAIDIVNDELQALPCRDSNHDPDTAEQLIDKLLETHAIVRRTPRAHRPARPRPGSSLAELLRYGERV
jgi:hypothetical protein